MINKSSIAFFTYYCKQFLAMGFLESKIVVSHLSFSHLVPDSCQVTGLGWWEWLARLPRPGWRRVLERWGQTDGWRGVPQPRPLGGTGRSGLPADDQDELVPVLLEQWVHVDGLVLRLQHCVVDLKEGAY